MLIKMIKINFFIIVIFLSFLNSAYSQDNRINIKGLAPQFIGNEIEFYYFNEQAFNSRETIAKVRVDTTGHFSFTFNSLNTIAIYCETNYTGYLFVVPGNNYSIHIPSFTPLQNTKNPFFIPPTLHILPEDTIIQEFYDLNYAIWDYNIIYEPFEKNHLIRYNFPERSKIKLDSFLNSVQLIQNVNDQEFYEDYIRYKTAGLEFLVNGYNRTELYLKYFKNRNLPMNNPAFWEFYNLYFDRYISSLSLRDEFRDMYLYLGKEKYSELNKFLKKDPVLTNDTIREFVLLTELYKGFYEKSYPFKLTINLIDSISRETSSSLTKKIAINLKNSILALQPGYLPPPLKFNDINGNEYNLESFKGKYIYLGFCSLSNSSCLKEFEYLKYQNSKHSKYLQIITVVPEVEVPDIKSFSTLNSITWPIVYIKEEKNVFRDYKVKSFPVFYLIGIDGKLILSPSPLPSENFEQVLFNVLRSDKMNHRP